MAGDSFGTVVKRRLLGVLFIVMIAALVTLSIMIYNKVFTSTVQVTLKANHTGNLLIVDSDVKERGIIVGSVKSVRSEGTGAIVNMSLDPTRTKDIPSNVTAQILPKTLFGEQYVSLVIPKHRDRSIRQGDVIPQDRSRGALESQNVISDLFPLLTAVRPAELNSTLTALADALHGRGDELGQTLVNFDRYLKVINPHTRQLVDDIEKLGRVAIEYNDVAPDIFTTLRNLQTSARTLVEKQKGLDSLLATGSDASGVLKSFLSDNEQRIITVTGQTNKVFPLLNKFSPEFSCLFTGLNKLYNLAGQAIYDNQIHLSATVDANLKPYKPGQEPRFVSGFGPNCFGLPHPPKPFQIPNAYKCVNDGVPLSDAPCAQSAGADDKALNSRAENSYVDTLIAGSLHTTPKHVSGTATLLAAPMLRGHQVVLK